MVKDALREGLPSSVGPEVGGESEGLVDGQVGFDVEHGGSSNLSLLEDVATTSVEHTVDASDSVLGTLDFDQVDGLHEPGGGGEHAGVETPPGRGDDLSASSVDGVSVQGDVIDVESDSTHVLVTKDTLKDTQELISDHFNITTV